MNDLQVPVSAKSNLAALVRTFDVHHIVITIYYQDSHNNLCGLTHDRSNGVGGKWLKVEDFGVLGTKVLDGTPLTCTALKDHQYVFAMNSTGHIQMWGNYRPSGYACLGR